MKIKIIGIARGLNKDEIIPAFEAALTGGIKDLEITMNTEGASELIKIAKEHFKNSALIGAGTVLTLEDMNKALDSGSEFIVAPVINKEVIEYCNKNNIPVYPGALTPTEIYQAWTYGATMVKVFPANSMGGADYIKSVKGPLNDIKLLACNGVTPDNLSEYIQKGVDGIALGSGLFKKEWIKNKEFDKIKQTALKYTSL